ncbi:MAG TPA: lipid II flippase MurJ [Terriglobia bacterium]|nr:lipid II flippase MurJ [Terriglobia bacterium]
MSSKRQILRRSMVVVFFSLLGGLTGILVETSIAAKLGLSRTSDAFYIAFTVPYIITNLISATGQFSLVPFFSALEARHSPDELSQGFSYAVNIGFLGLSGIAVLGALTAPWLVRGIAPGFTLGQVELAAQLSKGLFLIIIPAGVAEVFRSFLFSKRRLALPSAASLIRNVTVIASILFTFERYGEYSIVIGYLVGYLVQFVILGGQILVLYPLRYSWIVAGGGEAFRNLRGAGRAQLVSASAWQAVTIVERIIASFLPAGTLTALNYGLKIMTSLTELLAGSIGTVTLPALSKATALEAPRERHKTFHDILEISLSLVSPAMVFCLMLDSNIIRLVFERGNFTPEATALMSEVFFYYSLSLVVYSLMRVLTFYLFARNESAVFFRLAVFQYGLNIGFDLLYVGVLRMGAIGIPLGLLSSLIVACGLAVQRDLADLRAVLDRSLGIFTLKNVLGSALAALTVWGLGIWFQSPASGFGNFLYLSALCGAGSLAYVAALKVSRAKGFSLFAAIWKRPEDS